MNRMAGGILILVLTLSVAAAQDKGGDKSDTPAEQYQALHKEFNEAARVAYLEAKSDDERNEAFARIDKLSPRFLELAATNPKDARIAVFRHFGRRSETVESLLERSRHDTDCFGSRTG